MSATPVSKTIPALVVGEKQVGENKIARNPVTFDADRPMLRKPSWIRVRLPNNNSVDKLKAMLRASQLVTVCEEASCPNIHECFSKGTATFMILGEVCTRRCAFCDVAHGRPKPPDANEPANLARAIRDMRLHDPITELRLDQKSVGAGKKDRFNQRPAFEKFLRNRSTNDRTASRRPVAEPTSQAPTPPPP